MSQPPAITAEILVEANACAGRPPITLAEAQRILDRAVEDGYLAPAPDDEPEPETDHDAP